VDFSPEDFDSNSQKKNINKQQIVCWPIALQPVLDIHLEEPRKNATTQQESRASASPPKKKTQKKRKDLGSHRVLFWATALGLVGASVPSTCG